MVDLFLTNPTKKIEYRLRTFQGWLKSTDLKSLISLLKSRMGSTYTHIELRQTPAECASIHTLNEQLRQLARDDFGRPIFKQDIKSAQECVFVLRRSSYLTAGAPDIKASDVEFTEGSELCSKNDARVQLENNIMTKLKSDVTLQSKNSKMKCGNRDSL